jgi:hypothetical protein
MLCVCVFDIGLKINKFQMIESENSKATKVERNAAHCVYDDDERKLTLFSDDRC